MRKRTEPEYEPSKLNTPMLNYRVYYMNPQEKLLTFLLSFFVGGVAGLVFYGGLFKNEAGAPTTLTLVSNVVVFIGVGLLASFLFFPMRRDQLKEKRKSQLTEQFCSFLDSLAVSLSSGMNMTDSIHNSYGDLKTRYGEGGVIIAEIREMINGLQNNISLEDMFLSLGERSDVRDIKNFGVVFGVCFRTGGNMSDVVHRTNQLIREKEEISREIETALTSNKTQFSAMMVIPVVIMMMLRFMSSTFADSFATTTGVTAITIAIGLFIGAYYLGQRIMNIKE